MCRHPANRACRTVTGNCMNYIGSRCNGRGDCSVTINNGNMGGDPCPGTYKFGAIALRCVSSSAQADEPNLIENNNPDQFDIDYNNLNNDNYGENNGYFIQLSSSTMYAIGSIISVLLIVNILCLAYYNCYSKSRKSKLYRKVSQIASSDEN